MKLESIETQALEIPFRFAFEHASFTRRTTETLWVTARTTRGVLGRGESCPRTYVTGESVVCATEFVEAHRPELVDVVHSLSDLAHWKDEHRESIDQRPAAWCAVELALLDALGRAQGRSVESLLGLSELAGRFRYSAVVGNVPLSRFQEIAGIYREMEMADFKLKLSGRLDDDAAKLAWLEASAPRAERVRVDANNLWNDLDEASTYLDALPRIFYAVEEPLEPNRYGELSELARRLELRIVLDESFLRIEQLDALDEARNRFILNVRVSKMGGLLRSLEVARAARERGIPMVVGAQVGETSLLARAALPVARAAGDLLLAHEGAFGARLLVQEPCEPSLVFGRGGLLPAPRPAAGLGVSLRLRTDDGNSWSEGRAEANG